MNDNHIMIDGTPRLRGEHGLVGNWLLKVGIWFALIGVVVFDAGSIAVNTFGLDGTANDIAIAVSTDIGDGHLETPTAIEDAAEVLAKENEAKLVKAEVDTEGVLFIKLRRTAQTLIVSRVGPIKKWGVITAEATASTR